MRDLSPVIYRGESTGKLREDANFRPFFFAESYGQAELYAGRGTQPIACVIRGKSVLDLTNLDYRNPDQQRLVAELTAEFDDWTCRISGEPRDVWDYLECGDLYDYEGNGSSERWNALFSIALGDMGFDAVRILDCTDGTNHQAVPVWVTSSRKNVREASLGEQLAAKLADASGSDAQIDEWLKQDHADLLERINRLSIVDDEYRLDKVHDIIPPDNLSAMGHNQDVAQSAVWRALPAGTNIRPGDWIALKRGYAEAHKRHINGVDFDVKSLPMVRHDDIYWAGTDEREFFYLPAAWRRECNDPVEYLKSLTPEQVKILCDGEQAGISEHQKAIDLLEDHILENFDHEACGIAHGPAHWKRVQDHGHAVARSLGIDPIIPHIFAITHDSQRYDEGRDPEHGRRAAEFIRQNQTELFGFLPSLQVEMLAHACELHSDGHVHSHAYAMACWDADRLDLWRVGIEPNPKYLCTAHAKQEAIIQTAQSVFESSQHGELFDHSIRQEY